MIATQAGRTDVTSSGTSGISERRDQKPEGSAPSQTAGQLGYPAAVAVWIGAGLVGWGLIAGLVMVLT